jgi:hypothetical protein
MSRNRASAGHGFGIWSVVKPSLTTREEWARLRWLPSHRDCLRLTRTRVDTVTSSLPLER